MNKKADCKPDPSDIVSRIHKSPHKIVLAITGGGTEAIGELLRHGKGSETVMEAIVPYSRESLTDLMGKEPHVYASADTALDIAMSAYRRAVYLDSKTGTKNHKKLIGIGVTCKLAKKEGERKGREHEFHFAFQSYYKTGTLSIYLEDDASREEQEKLTSDIILRKIAALSCPGQIAEAKLPENKMIRDSIEKEAKAELPVSELLLKTLEHLNSKDKKTMEPAKVDMGISDAEPKIIFSGSFNPCHKNHIEMAEIAAKKYNQPVSFEISLANVDKPPIDYLSLENRINSILKYRDEKYIGNLYLTNSPLFADKAILFPNATFIIGTDTLNRLFNEKYYRKNEDKKSLLEHFHKYNTRFLVFQRRDSDIANDMEIPDICDIVSMETYADDGTSSTKIRELCP